MEAGVSVVEYPEEAENNGKKTRVSKRSRSNNNTIDTQDLLADISHVRKQAGKI